ncbi:MAG: hypothetical protein ACLUVP_05785 [Acutalibacter sp.]
MLNSIWFFMIALSVVSALATGRVGSLSTALLEGAQSAVELSLFLLGSMCAWLGFLQIAEESGLSRLLARALAPVIGRLFPEYREDTAILGKIALNLSANPAWATPPHLWAWQLSRPWPKGTPPGNPPPGGWCSLW